MGAAGPVSRGEPLLDRPGCQLHVYSRDLGLLDRQWKFLYLRFPGGRRPGNTNGKKVESPVPGGHLTADNISETSVKNGEGNPH